MLTVEGTGSIEQPIPTGRGDWGQPRTEPRHMEAPRANPAALTNWIRMHGLRLGSPRTNCGGSGILEHRNPHSVAARATYRPMSAARNRIRLGFPPVRPGCHAALSDGCRQGWTGWNVKPAGIRNLVDGPLGEARGLPGTCQDPPGECFGWGLLCPTAHRNWRSRQ